MVAAIKMNETNTNLNCHNVRGASGESGCYQMTDATYNGYSKDTIGYIAPRTPTNETYVVTMKAQEWIAEGKSSERILLSWNAGESAKKCSKGVNKHKVKFDSCAYVAKGLQLIDIAYANE